MSYIALILEALKALPQVLGFIKSGLEAIRKMREDARINDAKKANNEGDTLELEKKLGNTAPGTPSGLADSVVRHKSGN